MASMCLEAERASLEIKVNKKAPFLFRSTDDGIQLCYLPLDARGNSMCGENDKDHSTIQVVADLEQLYSLKKVCSSICVVAASVFSDSILLEASLNTERYSVLY